MLRRTLFNWTKQDKRCKFSGKSSFSSYIQHREEKNKNKQTKTNKQTNLLSLACAGQRFLCCTQLEKEDDFFENVHVLSCFVQLKSVLFNLLCVFFVVLFFLRTLAINSVPPFFFFFFLVGKVQSWKASRRSEKGEIFMPVRACFWSMQILNIMILMLLTLVSLVDAILNSLFVDTASVRQVRHY